MNRDAILNAIEAIHVLSEAVNNILMELQDGIYEMSDEEVAARGDWLDDLLDRYGGKWVEEQDHQKLRSLAKMLRGED